jgi:hypothetical protein
VCLLPWTAYMRTSRVLTASRQRQLVHDRTSIPLDVLAMQIASIKVGQEVWL